CFFFQAEDGIRDYKVTGVQTCALPIFSTLPLDLQVLASQCVSCLRSVMRSFHFTRDLAPQAFQRPLGAAQEAGVLLLVSLRIGRSEERRVGKECRSRGST